MKLISSKIEQRSKLALLTVGALALTPLFTPTTVQAAVPAQAPAWGYRAKKDSDDKGNNRPEHRRRDRDNDRDDDDWRRDRDGDWRNPNGGGYNGGNGGNSRYTVTGTVTKVTTGNQFWVRADNGQGYLVTTRSNVGSINEGIRVQVTGYYDGTRLVSDSIRILGYTNGNGGYNGGYGGGYNGGYNGGYGGGYGGGYNNGGYNNGGYQGGWNNSGNAVNFPGYVQSVSYNDGVAFVQVRGDNGQIYNVRFRSNVGLRRGQRVRVIGKYSDGTVWATSIR